MKKIITILLLCAIAPFAAKAVIAFPEPVTVTQPDGTEITLQLHGDEFCNFTTTTDGYTVMKSDISGAWEYARISDRKMQLTGIAAHNPAQRPATDLNCLTTLPRMSRPHATPVQNEIKRVSQAMQRSAEQCNTTHYDYTKFHGLVILVEYEDCAFSRSDARELFNNMVNEKNYTGFMAEGIIAIKNTYTGSVRDYYYDNSLGLFDPHFDVVGPVKVPYTKVYVNQVNNAQTLVAEALRQADSQIDYSQYDTDGDGEVDMIYFIFAGAGSNYTGNNSKLIWPHASEVVGVELDGVKMGRYACSTEFYGRETSKTIDGIGTICHEFSHVLGLPDLYDTDYATNGQSIHPANWSVMASGSYLNNAKTPCAYSLYERYAVGFTTPETITEPGEYALDYIGTTGEGYRIDSPVENEYFLLENRTQTRWDKYLPGEGMLAFRVDSTNITAWQENEVNSNASHNYYELIRANPAIVNTSTVRDGAGDPYPGSGNVTDLKLQTHSGAHCQLQLTDITITADNKIRFTATKDETQDNNQSGIHNMTPDTAKGHTLEIKITGNMVRVLNAESRLITAYDIAGRVTDTSVTDTDGTATIVLPARGIYVITDGNRTAKIAL